jgi:N-sulfoglucosamine sulfohydrolase
MAGPNLLFINWHDTGRHFGCLGIDSVNSPRIDQLASEGVLFEQCFAAATLCSPSRGAMLTGRYPQSNGLMHLCHGNFDWHFNADVQHLAQLLGARGYYTCLHGFQHEAPHPDVVRLGFHDLCNEKPVPPIYPVPPCDVIAEGAAAFLRGDAARRRPFYLQLGFFETHRPYEFGGIEPDDSKGVCVPPYAVDNEAARADFARLQGAIRKADHNVGIVLDALRQSGLEDNTIVVFTVDHGVAVPSAKTTMYDPGLGVILAMRWPAGGISGGRRSQRLVSNVDIVPTLFDLLGLAKPENFDGISFVGEFDGHDGPAPRTHVFSMLHMGLQRAVRSERYKLIRYFEKRQEVKRPADLSLSGSAHEGQNGMVNLDRIQLFDLAADLLELHNLADDPAHADVRAELDGQLWHWMEAVDDPLLKGPTPPPRWHQTIADYRSWKSTSTNNE